MFVDFLCTDVSSRFPHLVMFMPTKEIVSKQAQLKIIQEELRNIHDEIRFNCSTIRRVAMIRTLSTLQKN